MNCRGKIISFEKPKVMGILNATPDSFYNKGREFSFPKMTEEIGNMIEEGADLLDLGGMSSRPGAEIISTQEEIDRIQPITEYIIKYYPEMVLSIDTLHAEVAYWALKQGASLINDISGSEYDKNMIATLVEFDSPLICMHMKGQPQNMQLNPTYNHVVNEVEVYFKDKIEELSKAGIEKVIIDPGFGFGKTLEHNFSLMADLQQLAVLGAPILVGISRKSMVYKPLGSNAQSALNGTTALHMFALMHGANLLRVHDVKEAKETILLYETLMANKL
ncbi:MAG: dihydropteroate synthase [Chitinophagaceae bacterium]|nr:dihydropteroate synthase [Chitinophagaceae bacterium]